MLQVEIASPIVQWKGVRTLCDSYTGSMGIKLISASHPACSSPTREKIKLATQCDSMAKVCHLLFVSDRFLVDSGTQISIIPANEEDRLKGPHKLTLQTVNKSLIQI